MDQNDRKCRIVSYDQTVFRVVHIAALPPGRVLTMGFECGYCGRMFIGTPSENSAGFAHDCEIPRQLKIDATEGSGRVATARTT